MANKKYSEVLRNISSEPGKTEESTRHKKGRSVSQEAGSSSSSLGEGVRTGRRKDRLCADSGVSSRTRAKTMQLSHSHNKTLRGRRRKRGGKGEKKKAEEERTSSAHNTKCQHSNCLGVYPTPPSSAAELDLDQPPPPPATALEQASSRRRIRSTTSTTSTTITLCPRPDNDTPPSSHTHRWRTSDHADHSARACNASPDSDVAHDDLSLGLGDEQSDERNNDVDDGDDDEVGEEEREADDDEEEGDRGEEEEEGARCADKECVEVSLEGGCGEGEGDSVRCHHHHQQHGHDGADCTCVSSGLPLSTSPAHSVKAGSKRRISGSEDDASPPKKSHTVSCKHGHRKLSQEYQTDRQSWLDTFKLWSNAERVMALDELIGHCELPQVRHMMQMLEPHFQRDFISLLPKELALYVLSFLKPKDLLRAAQCCHYWHVLCEDNLLWREKCTEEGIDHNLVFGSRAHRRSHQAKQYKALYLRQSGIEHKWRTGSSQEPLILRAHDDHVITCLEFCGQRIVSGSDDNTLKVWSAVTGKCLQTLVGHTGGVWSSQMSGNIIISGSTDRSLKIWNAETGACRHTLYGHTSTVRCMSLYDRKVVSGSRDATMRVWDIDNGHCLHVLTGHMAAVRCVQYNGHYVVSGAYDYSVRVWNPQTETCLHVLQGHTNRVYSLQFDGVHIVSGSLDTSIRVWGVEGGQCLHTLVGHQSLTSGLELKDNLLVSGNADSTVKVWDVTTGQCLQTLQGPNKHQSAVTCLQFNKKFVVTSSDDGTVKIWDLHSGEFLRNLVRLPSGGSGGVVWRLRCSNTKLVCAVGSRNGTEETKLMVLDFDVENRRTVAASSASSPSSLSPSSSSSS